MGISKKETISEMNDRQAKERIKMRSKLNSGQLMELAKKEAKAAFAGFKVIKPAASGSNWEDPYKTPEDPLPLSWFEFLLDKTLLEKHLRKENPDPPATTLLAQFVLNAEKTLAEHGSFPLEEPDSDEGEDDDRDQMLNYKLKKAQTLKLFAFQTCAFLSWDLDTLATIHIGTQHALMKHIVAESEINSEDGSYIPREFLKVLYHRWVLRTLQSQNSFSKTSRFVHQADVFVAFENVWKQLNEEESVHYLNNCLNKPELVTADGIRIPNMRTFNVPSEPDWREGDVVEKNMFDSMIHLDLGIFLLHKGNTVDAVAQFQKQNIPTSNFPYLKISKAKLEGYLRSVGLLTTFDKNLEDRKVIPRSLDHEKMLEMSRLIKKNLVQKLKKISDLNLESLPGPEKLHSGKRDKEDGTYFIPGDDKLSLFSMEKSLIETTNAVEIKEILIKLHSSSTSRQGSSTPRSFSKLFSGWELPIPVQHATLNIPPGLFQDYIYILVAKSRQLLNSKVYSEARSMLLTAAAELQIQLQQGSSPGMNPFLYNLGKLAKMMEWEILLIDINHFISQYPLSPSASVVFADLKVRCRDCLICLQSQSTDVNPRSEIVENILMTYINLGEYGYVANFDQMQTQRWPFIEFIALLARVCQDLFVEEKCSSSSYRELWSAVLPIFSNNTGSMGGGNSKKPLTGSVTTKPAILSSRSALTWVIERSCSHPLLSVWVSLLSRLHNHIFDDAGMQIQTEYLSIWPNILDDVTTSSAAVELKTSRVSGSSKLNSRHIRDFLFSLLDRAIKISNENEMVAWLRCLGDVHLASGAPSLSIKCYLEYLVVFTDFFDKQNSPQWNDNFLFKRMIKCCEMMGCFTQAVVLCQFLMEVDYSMAFGMAQEKTTNDSSDSLYGFVWDLTILEFLINLHTKRNESAKRQQAIRVMGLLELNTNNNEEIRREAMTLRKSQFMRTLAKHYIFV